MFEVLLQADRALASGALDQAERSYWQLIELDPTNAIAVAGLARISMERGDHRLARTFADRALVMDPEMVAAKRILETLKGGSPGEPASDLPDFPLLAAQRLEALGRRRVAAAEEEAVGDERACGGKPGKPGEDGADEIRTSLPQLPVEQPTERRQAGRRAAAAPEAAAAEAAAPPQAPPRSKAHQALGERARRNLLPDDQKPPPRSEDPFAAAESAAAIEAVDETDDVVIEAHVGRLPSSHGDKMGAVLGAADARGEDESVAMRVALVPDATRLAAAELAEATFGAIDATGEDETIAMRVALVGDATQLEAAEMGAAEMGAAESRAAGLDASAAELESAELNAEAERDAAEFDEDVFGVAELVASEELGPVPAHRIDLDALEAELRAAELRANLPEAGEHDAAAQPEDDAAAQTEAEAEAELVAAELTSAELATADRASEWIAEAEADAASPDAGRGLREPPVLPAKLPTTGEEVTEQDAEAAALREAVALVLGVEADGAGNAAERGEAYGTEAQDSAARPAGGELRTAAPNPLPPAGQTGSDDPRVEPAGEGADPAAGGAEPAESTSPATTEPRRKGLLRRFRGD